ncbi:hypothetical protein BKK81_32955 (plasmid) [Cupriavidus sp. USMAHM13]|uniref:hypothetical protein n=1 Tax=Cupriavidus sp. USMAHM13 TaxID=1389192 RepID=UPI0008A6EECA|nr:hypothetical protein [Cupriavidus sp. USMAHM13]AOZ04208.1 hypothetical protein BKK81_32955 [Cupriavidus sp. USMAHM13]
MGNTYIEISDQMAGGLEDRVEQWRHAKAEGAVRAGFDSWLEMVVAREGARRPGELVIFRQGGVTFGLEHGAIYEVESTAKGVRRFRCILDGALPLIAFVDIATGVERPWVTLVKLFSAKELRSLSKVR